MTSDRLHAHWREIKGWTLENWGRVTGDHYARVAGKREKLLGQLQASLAESREITGGGKKP